MKSLLYVSKKPPVTSRDQVERGIEETVKALDAARVRLDLARILLAYEWSYHEEDGRDVVADCERDLAYCERVGCVHVCVCGGHKHWP